MLNSRTKETWQQPLKRGCQLALRVTSYLTSVKLRIKPNLQTLASAIGSGVLPLACQHLASTNSFSYTLRACTQCTSEPVEARKYSFRCVSVINCCMQVTSLFTSLETFPTACSLERLSLVNNRFGLSCAVMDRHRCKTKEKRKQTGQCLFF